MKYLYGASGHAKVILEIITSNNEVVSGIFDDDTNKKSFESLNFLGIYNPNIAFEKDAQFLISIGDNRLRKIVSKKIQNNFFNALHKQSILSESCKLGYGTVVMANVVINAGTDIGNHCILNTASVIEHDCTIKDFTHIAPNATITGGVIIGEGSLIGARSVVIPGVNIGKWCIIGAGSVIIEDVPDYAVIVGNPGKIIRYNEQ